jgi:hypothetical protein
MFWLLVWFTLGVIPWFYDIKKHKVLVIGDILSFIICAAFGLFGFIWFVVLLSRDDKVCLDNPFYKR